VGKLLSLRDSVKGAVVELLDHEEMACLKTQDGLVELISALANYTEEGRALFPRIFVFDSLPIALGMMPGSECVHIGDGPKSAATMSRALKKCAPLAFSGWAIYIERRPADFSFGLLRSGSTVLSLGPEDALVDHGTPEVPVLLLHQVGANLIELRGVRQGSLLIHFGASRGGETSPAAAISRFVEEIVGNVPEHYREQTATFYRNLMVDVLHASHGTLAVVVSSRKRILPKQFSDAVNLEPKLDVCGRISDLLSKPDGPSGERLRACSALIKGMLLSDGITVFGSNASVWAYNVFVKHPRGKSAEAMAGGARSRTFSVLADMLGNGLSAAFMQSQDGRIEFRSEGFHG
jgi:hypothetical protein